MLKEKIKKDIQNNLHDSDVKVLTNDDKHYNIVIISDFFKNKDLFERQQIINEIISCYIINKEIHAVSFKTYTKQEWIDLNEI